MIWDLVSSYFGVLSRQGNMGDEGVSLPSGSYCRTCKLQSLSATRMNNLSPSGRKSAATTSR